MVSGFTASSDFESPSCIFGGSALGCTGDVKSPFLVVSLGELPMIEFDSGQRGSRERVQYDDVIRSAIGLEIPRGVPSIVP